MCAGRFVWTYFTYSAMYVFFQTDEKRLSIQTLGTETYWSIWTLIGKTSAEIHSSAFCREQIHLKEVKITSLSTGQGSIYSGSYIYIFLTDTCSVEMVRVTTIAYFIHHQCAPRVYRRKLSAYPADVCKLASMGQLCGCNPLVHTAETKVLYMDMMYKSALARYQDASGKHIKKARGKNNMRDILSVSNIIYSAFLFWKML